MNEKIKRTKIVMIVGFVVLTIFVAGCGKKEENVENMEIIDFVNRNPAVLDLFLKDNPEYMVTDIGIGGNRLYVTVELSDEYESENMEKQLVLEFMIKRGICRLQGARVNGRPRWKFA